MLIFILIVFLTVNSLFGETPPTELYPIVVNKKIGFIDSTGKVIVEPTYLAAGKCSEMLIPVRKGGYYGYINTLGEVVIPFKYDYATEFSEGLAVVYRNGKPKYIDKNGENAFDINLKELSNFSDSNAIVIGYNNTYGIINRQGKLIVDTINEYIDRMESATYRVVMKYDNVWNPFERYVDRHGQTITDSNVIMLYRHRSSRTPKDLNYLNSGRYYKETRPNSYQLTDDKGTILCDSAFTMIERFSNGNAVVSTRFGDGLIDTNGNILIQPIYSSLFHTGNKDYMVYQLEYDYHSGKTSEGFGIITTNGRIVTLPKYFWDNNTKEVVKSPSMINLLYRDTSFWMTYEGVIKWSMYSPPKSKTLDTINIDYLHFTRYEPITQRTNDIPKEPPKGIDDLITPSLGKVNFDLRPKVENIKPTMREQLSDGLNLIAHTEDTITYSDGYIGFVLHIVNNSEETLYLDSYNTSILPIMQALTPKGEWKDIEYIPSGWCGTGRGSEAISPKKYYELEAPLFAGEIKTRLRVKLVYFNSPSVIHSSESKPQEVYSNEFIGYINPGQLWRSKYHTPDKLSIFRR